MSCTETATRELGARNGAAARLPSTRSAVTNGTRVFVEGDGNSAWTRRFKDLVANHASDLGGSDLLSEAQLSLIRRCAAMEIELEQMEGKLSKGEDVNLDLYTRTAGHLRRYLETLGISRQANSRTLDLKSYIAAKAAESGQEAGTQ